MSIVPGQGWRTPAVIMVAGGLCLGLSIGIRHSFGLFLPPMSTELGWGREVFAIAIAIQNLLWGATQPVFGLAADRWGAGRTIALGGLLYAGGIWLMASSSSPGELYLTTGLLVGIGLSGTSFATVLGAVGRAFPPERRSAALGVASALGSFGQFAFVPAGQAFIDAYGWATALVLVAALATGMVALALPLAGRPQALGGGEAESARQAFAEARAHRGYLLLCLGFFVCGFHITFIGTHLPAWLGDRGIGAAAAATALALIGLFNVLGSLLCGWLGGRVSKRYLLSLMYFARAVVISAFVLLPPSPWVAYLACAGLGLLWLGTVPLTSGLVAQIFGPKYLGALFGIVFFSHQLGAGLGVWLGGRIYDALGSYDPVWWLAVLLGILAGLLHLPIDERPLVRVPAAGA